MESQHQEQIEENKATKAAMDRQKYLEGGRIKQELVSATFVFVWNMFALSVPTNLLI